MLIWENDMKLKTFGIIILTVVTAVMLLGCSAAKDDIVSGETTQTKSAAPDGTAQLSLTLEELAQYNGQNDMPAYVAIDGTIYDMSAIAPWAGGLHNGHIAGSDLTQELKTKSPHGISVLKKLPVVGTIKE